jgi:hypothetical protein
MWPSGAATVPAADGATPSELAAPAASREAAEAALTADRCRPGGGARAAGTAGAACNHAAGTAGSKPGGGATLLRCPAPAELPAMLVGRVLPPVLPTVLPVVLPAPSAEDTATAAVAALASVPESPVGCVECRGEITPLCRRGESRRPAICRSSYRCGGRCASFCRDTETPERGLRGPGAGGARPPAGLVR